MNIRPNPDTTLPAVTTGPLPSSRKIFATPQAASDLRVPLREIILSEGAGEFKLGDLVAVEPAQGLVMRVEGLGRVGCADIAVVFRLDAAAVVLLDAAALLHPGGARA